MGNRRGNPNWTKGMKSPNPLGRAAGGPKKEFNLEEALEKFTPEVVYFLRKFLKDSSVTDTNKLKAALKVLEYHTTIYVNGQKIAASKPAATKDNSEQPEDEKTVVLNFPGS